MGKRLVFDDLIKILPKGTLINISFRAFGLLFKCEYDIEYVLKEARSLLKFECEITNVTDSTVYVRIYGVSSLLDGR